jgi:hypothetical protein
VTPALALGVLLVPIVVRLRAPRAPAGCCLRQAPRRSWCSDITSIAVTSPATRKIRARGHLPMGPRCHARADRAVRDRQAVSALRRPRHQPRRLSRRTDIRWRISPDRELQGVADGARRWWLPVRGSDPRANDGGARRVDAGRSRDRARPALRTGRPRLQRDRKAESPAVPVRPRWLGARRGLRPVRRTSAGSGSAWPAGTPARNLCLEPRSCRSGNAP